MGKAVAFVTGAGGEMGQLLVPALVERGFEVVALDLKPLPQALRSICRETLELDLLETAALESVFNRIRPDYVFHLAAILSSQGERDWTLAHRVNVESTLALFHMSLGSANPVRFLFPSSIAVYGLPDARTKTEVGAITETEWTAPRSVYGCNKLYCEVLGSHLATPPGGGRETPFDFRAIRFPGLISADTLPSGGTTDFAPEMIHAAARDQPYTCFVREDSRLPFMTMPDAVQALLRLAAAEGRRLTRRVYNIRGFSCSAGEIRTRVLARFPGARIGFEVDPLRQSFVDSWPADLDDEPARRDWGLAPEHDLDRALADYLLPALERRYAAAG